ncbi:hypothetical protein ACFL7D_11755 [candidate division KSB1 bacterium]
MSKNLIIYLILPVFLLVSFAIEEPYLRTDFTMTVYISNKSDVEKRFFLEKGRILEIARINSSHFQSIIITDGDGWITIPAGETIKRKIKGVCLNDGLKFPPEEEKIVLTPFVGNQTLIDAGDDQEKVSKITEFPLENVSIVTGKGYSDPNNDGIVIDKDEAFRNAVENASRESGFIFSSQTILENLKMIQTKQKIQVEEKSIKLLKIIHEEYDEKTGQYLYIGEFEVRSKPSAPQIIK